MCMRNQLTAHTGKTETMISKANGFIGPLRPIMFGNAVINYVTNSTCLGIVIDNRLTQLWPVFCRRGNGSPLCDTVTVTAELDEVTVTPLNEEQTFTNSR